MTYEQLYKLKFEEGVSTYELLQRYPQDAERVSEVALMDIPEGVLKEVIQEEEMFQKLIKLKKHFVVA